MTLLLCHESVVSLSPWDPYCFVVLWCPPLMWSGPTEVPCFVVWSGSTGVLWCDRVPLKSLVPWCDRVPLGSLGVLWCGRVPLESLASWCGREPSEGRHTSLPLKREQIR